MAATLANTLNKDQLAEVKREAWSLRVKGWTLESIAAKFGVAPSTISRQLASIEKGLAKEFVSTAEQIKARQTAQLEEIAASALRQFDRSCEDAEKRKTVSKRVSNKPASEEEDDARDFCADTPPDLDNSGYVIEETLEVQGQSGNPALLAQVRGAYADIRSIWGLDKGIDADATGVEVTVKILRGVSMDDL